jgi:hypothetical protein
MVPFGASAAAKVKYSQAAFDAADSPIIVVLLMFLHFAFHCCLLNFEHVRRIWIGSQQYLTSKGPTL